MQKKYEGAVTELDTKLSKQAIGVQVGTDGWKCKNVNAAQKLQNFLVLYPDGSSAFLGVENDMATCLDNVEYFRVLEPRMDDLGKRLGDIKKVSCQLLACMLTLCAADKSESSCTMLHHRLCYCIMCSHWVLTGIGIHHRQGCSSSDCFPAPGGQVPLAGELGGPGELD